MVKLAVRAAAAGALTLAAITLTATAASAHHADITASANCSGVVSFTASAWEGQGAPGSAELEGSRTNPTIEVAWGTGGEAGAFTVLPHKPAYHVGADNGYAFSDTITPAPALAPGTVVTVRVRAAAPFANGVVDGQFRYATATIPAPCTVPTVAVTCPSSVVFGTAATYTAVPTGDGPFTYQWTLNGAPISGATANTVSVTRNSPSDAVAVTVTDSHAQKASASALCSGTYPGPAVTISCPQGMTFGQPATWTAVVTTNPSNPVTYQWSLNGTPISGATASTVTTTVSSASDTISVTVRDSQTPALIATATASCMGTVPPTIVSPNTDTSVPASTPPAAQTDDATDDTATDDSEDADESAQSGEAGDLGVEGTALESDAAAEAGTLAATGSDVSGLLLSALSLLAAGAAMMAAPRLKARRR